MAFNKQKIRPASKLHVVNTAFMIVAMLAALATMFYGLYLRFHIENTNEAIIQSAIGAKWLLLAIFLFLLTAWQSWIISGSRWVVVAIISPAILSAIPALLYDGNILPYFAALFTGLVAIIGVIATVTLSLRKPSGASGNKKDE